MVQHAREQQLRVFLLQIKVISHGNDSDFLSTKGVGWFSTRGVGQFFLYKKVQAGSLQGVGHLSLLGGSGRVVNSQGC